MTTWRTLHGASAPPRWCKRHNGVTAPHLGVHTERFLLPQSLPFSPGGRSATLGKVAERLCRPGSSAEEQSLGRQRLRLRLDRDRLGLRRKRGRAACNRFLRSAKITLRNAGGTQPRQTSLRFAMLASMRARNSRRSSSVGSRAFQQLPGSINPRCRCMALMKQASSEMPVGDGEVHEAGGIVQSTCCRV